MKNLPSGVPIPGACGVKSLPTGVEIPASGGVKNLPTGLELAPLVPISIGPLGVSSNGAIPKPAGLASAKVRIYLAITWFADGLGPPTVPGFTLVDWISDLRAFDQTATALLYQDYADGTTVPADFTPAELKKFAEEARRRLLRVKDVNKVVLVGERPEKVLICCAPPSANSASCTFEFTYFAVEGNPR